MRHNKTERVGMHKIAATIEDKFGWVFREQSIADVGIDATVEHAIDGDPTGKFMALQVKSGKGNVHESEGHYTYYISHTHYYYWINLDLPILLLCYIKKKKGKIFWVELNKETMKKTNRRWKVDIPKINLLNVKSYGEIEKIMLKGKGRLLLPKVEGTDQDVDVICKISAFKYAIDSIDQLSAHQKLFSKNINEIGSRISIAKDLENKNEYAIEIKRLEREIQYVLESMASRSYAEVHIYAILFSDVVQGFIRKCLVFSRPEFNALFKTIEEDKVSLEKLLSGLGEAIYGVEFLRDSLNGTKKSFGKKTEKSMSLAIMTVELIIEELYISRSLLNDLVAKMKK